MVLRHFSAMGNEGRITQQTCDSTSACICHYYTFLAATQGSPQPPACAGQGLVAAVCVSRVWCSSSWGCRTPYTWRKQQLIWAQIRKYSTCTWNCLMHWTLFPMHWLCSYPMHFLAAGPFDHQDLSKRIRHLFSLHFFWRKLPQLC